MKRQCLLTLIFGVLLFESGSSQVRWMVGGGFGPSPIIRRTVGTVGLQSKADRIWSLGISSPFRGSNKKLAWGFLGSVVLRSPFYELDRALPYYPLKTHIPTFLVESVQLFPFISYSNRIGGARSRLGWEGKLGPVFVFHDGSYISSSTAYTVPDRTPFYLYQHQVDRQPAGIPLVRGQLGITYQFDLGRRLSITLHPFSQVQLADRYRLYYQTTPLDPIHASSGTMRNRPLSYGLLCHLERRR